MFCRSYGSADILTREVLELAQKIVFVMKSQQEMVKQDDVEMLKKQDDVEMVKKQEIIR